MARPIKATPVLEGKDAQRLCKEVKETNKPTASTIRILNKYVLVYKDFYSRASVSYSTARSTRPARKQKKK